MLFQGWNSSPFLGQTLRSPACSSCQSHRNGQPQPPAVKVPDLSQVLSWNQSGWNESEASKYFWADSLAEPLHVHRSPLLWLRHPKLQCIVGGFSLCNSILFKDNLKDVWMNKLQILILQSSRRNELAKEFGYLKNKLFSQCVEVKLLSLVSLLDITTFSKHCAISKKEH